MDTLVTTQLASIDGLCDSGRFDEALEVATGPIAVLVEGIRLAPLRPDKAKDLISQAARSLEGNGRLRAEIALACCYSYSGEVNEGKVVIRSVLAKAKGAMRERALLTKGALEIDKPKKAKETLAPLQFDSAALQGKLHNQRARTLCELKEYDAAIIEYSGAAHYFELDDNPILSAIALNNQAGILRKRNLNRDAYEAADRAIRIAENHRSPYLPQFLDQKCKILLSEHRGPEGLKLIERAISLVSDDRIEVLAECLITKAWAYAELDNAHKAFSTLREAQRLAESLERDDLVLAVAKGRKTITESLWRNADRSLVEIALQKSNRSYRAAGVKLGITHAAVKKAVERYNLNPHKPRLKSILRHPKK